MLMTKNSTAFTGGSSPNVSVANTTIGSVGALQDNTVQLLKNGSAVGSNKASATTWANTGTLSTVTYGSSTDLWGTTWTAADVNDVDFGLRFVAKNVAAATSTASIDSITITVYYTPNPDGIGTPGTPVKTANIGGTCQYRAQAAHTPCTSTDHVYATTITTTSAASNPALVMPTVDFNYWWANAKPGPKHFCTNSNPGLATNFFDNDAGTTSAPNKSILVNGEMAPADLVLHLPGGRERRAPGRALLEQHDPRADHLRHDLRRRELPLRRGRRDHPLLRPREHHVLEGRRDRRLGLRRRHRH